MQGELVLHPEELNQLRVVDLRNALRAEAENYEAGGGRALVADIEAGYLEEEGPYQPIAFEWDGQALIINISHLVEWPEDDVEEEIIVRIRTLIEPLITAARATLIDVEDDQFRWNARDLRVDILSGFRTL